MRKHIRAELLNRDTPRLPRLPRMFSLQSPTHDSSMLAFDPRQPPQYGLSFPITDSPFEPIALSPPMTKTDGTMQSTLITNVHPRLPSTTPNTTPPVLPSTTQTVSPTQPPNPNAEALPPYVGPKQINADPIFMTPNPATELSPQRPTDVSRASFEFRSTHVAKFKSTDDDPAEWLRAFEFFILCRDPNPNYDYATLTLMYFIPPNQHDKVKTMVDTNTTWTEMKNSFISGFKPREAVTNRRLTDISNLRQSPTETVPELLDRMRALYKKAGMTWTSEQVKLILRTALRKELRHALIEHYHLTLPELETLLERKEIALVEEPTSQPQSTPAAAPPTFSVTDQPAPHIATGPFGPTPQQRVDHTVQAIDAQREDRICYNCGIRGHLSAVCRKRKQNSRPSRPDSQRSFHPYNNGWKQNNQRYTHSTDSRNGRNYREGNSNHNDRNDRYDYDNYNDNRDERNDDRSKQQSPSQTSKNNRSHSNSKYNRHSNDSSKQDKHTYSKGDRVESAKTFSVNATADLMRVHMTVHGCKVNALVDTGASVSVFNIRLCPVQPDPTPVDAEVVWIVSALQKMKAKAIGYAVLKTQLNDWPEHFDHKYLLTDKLNEDVILGMDFLAAHGILIDTPNRTLRLPDRQIQVQCNTLRVRDRMSPTSPDHFLFAKDSHVLHPGQSVSIAVKSIIPLDEGIYATKDDQSRKDRGTLVTEQVINAVHGKHTAIVCSVSNPSAVPVLIKAGERIATAERIINALVQSPNAYAEPDTDTVDTPTIPPTVTTDPTTDTTPPTVPLTLTDTTPPNAVQHSLEHMLPADAIALRTTLNKHGNVFYAKGNELPATNLTEHHIHLKPGTEPTFTPQYPLPQTQYEAAKKLLLEMLRDGIVEPTRSPFNSPIILVMKANGEWRFVTDFRKLNEVTIPDRYPMTRQDDIFRDLLGMHLFTTIDLKSGFWQIEIAPQDRHLTAFSIAGVGQFHYIRLPFGLSNSPATFCRVISTAISGCTNLMLDNKRVSVARAYVDDLIIASHDLDSHLAHLDLILKALGDAKLTVNPTKCTWTRQSIRFLGHVVSGDGIRICPDRVKIIAEWITPHTRKGVLRFLGLANYCRQFVPNFASICRPLYEVCRTKTGFSWQPEQQVAFDAIKTALQNTDKLAIAIFDGRPFIISADASDAGIGAVLEQTQDDGVARPIAFAGRNLKPNEKLFGISEKECLALVFALHQFRLYTEGFPVQVNTDHSALVWLKTKSRLNNRRLQLWALTIQSAMPDINYIPGPQMVVPDALSRCTQVDDPEQFLADSSLASTTQELNTLNIVQQSLLDTQHQDPHTSPLLNLLENGTLPSDPRERARVKAQASAYRISNGMLFHGTELVIPAALRHAYLVEAHDSPLGGHVGEHKTLDHLRPYFWKGMSRDVRSHVRACISCGLRKNKPPTPKPQLTTDLVEPYQPFTEVNIDMIVGLPISKRANTVILTIVDKMSRWVEAYALPDSTASTIADVFATQFITRFGCPIRLTSDRGSNFTSELFQEFLKALNIQQRFSPAYCPWINGAVERTNGTIITMLSNFANQNGDNWDDMLPFVLFAHRAASNRMTGYSPFQLVFGTHARQPSIASLLGNASRSTNSTSPADSAATYVGRLSRALKQSWTHAAVADANYRDPVSGSDQEASMPVIQQRSHEYTVGDEVWIYQPNHSGKPPKFAEDWSAGWRVSKILSKSRLVVQRGSGQGRFDVREVHVDRVKPNSAPMTERAPMQPPPPITKPRHKRSRATIVDKIVNQTFDDLGKTWYQVRWVGCSSEEDTIEPEEFFVSNGARNPVLTRWIKKHNLSS